MAANRTIDATSLSRKVVGKSNHKDDTMETIASRFFTFFSYPKRFPSATLFANAGLYYQSKDDEVVCCICCVTISQWQAEDDPKEVHKTLSPECSYIASLSTSSGISGMQTALVAKDSTVDERMKAETSSMSNTDTHSQGATSYTHTMVAGQTQRTDGQVKKQLRLELLGGNTESTSHRDGNSNRQRGKVTNWFHAKMLAASNRI